MIDLISEGCFVLMIIFCVITKFYVINNKKIEKNNENFIQKYGNYIFCFIFICSVFVLLYKLSDVPQGLHVDEAGAMYDAISISKYGVDRYLYKFPVYFINFGGGQNALYTYLAALLFKIFTINTFIFRLPAVILSLISVILLYKMIAENNGKKEAVITTLILVICPFFIMKSRWGLESYLMCSLLIISIYVFIKALNYNKTYMYFLSGLFFGITLYTYAISYIVVPGILLITLLYMLLNKKIKIKNILIMAIPLAILALPLILMLAYNDNILKNVKIPFFSIPKLWFFRGGEISIKNIHENIKNIFDILFIKDFLNYNSIEKFGTLYKMSIPLIVFGFIEVIANCKKDIKNKEITLDLMMMTNFIVVFIVGMCIAELNINKINAIYIPMIYFSGRFLAYISDNIKNVIYVVILLYMVNFGMFCKEYFIDYANSDLMYFESDIIQATQKAESLNKTKIYVEDCLNQTYIYTLIANQNSPYEFCKNIKIENGRVLNYGKYLFDILDNIDEDCVYILKEDNSNIEKISKNGYKSEKYGSFIVLWF